MPFGKSEEGVFACTERKTESLGLSFRHVGTLQIVLRLISRVVLTEHRAGRSTWQADSQHTSATHTHFFYYVPIKASEYIVKTHICTYEGCQEWFRGASHICMVYTYWDKHGGWGPLKVKNYLLHLYTNPIPCATGAYQYTGFCWQSGQ